MAVECKSVRSSGSDFRDRVRGDTDAFCSLQNWPESYNAAPGVRRRVYRHPRVVDSSISCRQMYLMSYKFSRKKETVPERAKKRLRQLNVIEKVKKKKKVWKICRNGGGGRYHAVEEMMVMVRKAKKASRAALSSFFQKVAAFF